VNPAKDYQRRGAYGDPRICRAIIDEINRISRKQIRLMEVCGTHTVSIFKSGIRSMIPGTISLLSGPGCPVCVTTRSEIDAFIELSRMDEVIIVTHGDLMRVPGTDSSLLRERARGRDIRVVFSSLDALAIAEQNLSKKIVFLGIGFETTAPSVAASLISAKTMGAENYFVFSAHKRIPPALFALMQNRAARVDGFILPGHVSVIIGQIAYVPFFERFKIPCVIAGFEPTDILLAILTLAEQLESNHPALVNIYSRAVSLHGNQKAKGVMEEVFEPVDVKWRGLGKIPESGLKIRESYASFDAERAFDIAVPEGEDSDICACGDILAGVKTPPECPLFKKPCTPLDPLGPCMVSREGVCSAYYRYHQDRKVFPSG